MRFLQDFNNREMPHVTEEERMLVVRMVVDHLVKVTGTHYPTGIQKEAAAKAIVHALPCLSVRVEGVAPWAHFYNSKTNSFIGTRLKYLRDQHLNPSERRRTTKAGGKAKKNQKLLDESSPDDFTAAKLLVRLNYLFVSLNFNHLF